MYYFCLSLLSPFLWNLRGLIWLQRVGENAVPKETHLDGLVSNFCPSCTGSDLITCPRLLRVYDTQLRSVEPGHSWISHSQACFPPDFCLLVKNFNFLWPQGSFYQPGKSTVSFFLFAFFSFFKNINVFSYLQQFLSFFFNLVMAKPIQYCNNFFWSNSTLGWSKKKAKDLFACLYLPLDCAFPN